MEFSYLAQNFSSKCRFIYWKNQAQL